jgi:hypothetical protein
MKKYLPIILFAVGLVVVVGTFLFVRGRGGSSTDNDDENVAELPFEKKPIASLTPSEDGHWLTLIIDKIEVDAETLDYELVYVLPDGRNQGPGGSIKLKGEKKLERRLLLGSESSGNYYYDEGVENGTLTLRFRNKKGKLLAKLSTDFTLATGTQEYKSFDGKFTFTRLNKNMPNDYYIVMETFGAEKVPDEKLISGPYGIFSSSSVEEPGKVNMNGEKLYLYKNNDWLLLEGNKTVDIGIFVSTE